VPLLRSPPKERNKKERKKEEKEGKKKNPGFTLTFNGRRAADTCGVRRPHPALLGQNC